MATAVPAAAIGIGDRLGRLAPGLPADLVHLDDDGLALAGVWRAGRAVEMRP
jgi:N-acetylglucosamine-6-phosphate deacetylase